MLVRIINSNWTGYHADCRLSFKTRMLDSEFNIQNECPFVSLDQVNKVTMTKPTLETSGFHKLSQWSGLVNTEFIKSLIALNKLIQDQCQFPKSKSKVRRSLWWWMKSPVDWEQNTLRKGKTETTVNVVLSLTCMAPSWQRTVSARGVVQSSTLTLAHLLNKASFSQLTLNWVAILNAQTESKGILSFALACARARAFVYSVMLAMHRWS